MVATVKRRKAEMPRVEKDALPLLLKKKFCFTLGIFLPMRNWGGGGGGELPHSCPFAIFWSIPKSEYYNPPPPFKPFFIRVFTVSSRFHGVILHHGPIVQATRLARRPPTSSAHSHTRSTTEVQVRMDLHPRCVDVLLKCWFWILQTLSCLKKIRASNDFRVFGLFWACFYVAVKELFLLSFS